MRQSNYEITKEKMAKHFLDFDQGTMISRMHLRYDSRYLYIRFVGRWYRIDRSSGLVQWSEDGFRHGIEGDFNEAMSIYDLLCCSKEGCCLAGEFVKLRGLCGRRSRGRVVCFQCPVVSGEISAPCSGL